ncbi:uncharacterized protein ACNLHF_009073 [Anomaloglossus baeobatrachus]
MEVIVLISVIATALISTTRVVKCSPLGTETLQLRDEETEQTQQEHLAAENTDGVVEFLALLEKAEKIASSRFAAKITGIKANKLFGKKNRLDEAREERPSPSFHLEENVDHTDEIADNTPVRGRHFRKISQNLPRKSKKRACFWKYCIQNK